MISVKSAESVLSALDFAAEQSENLRLRAELMVDIEAVIEPRKLKQVATAQLYGVSQSRVNN